MSRNPVAGNARKYNKSHVIPNKKRADVRQKRYRRYYETDYNEVGDAD